MTTDALLDRILVPRPNGSQALSDVADFLAKVLREQGATVSLHQFTATPHGFQLVWTAALLGMLGYVVACARRRYGLALLIACAVPGLLLAEFEALRSPVSGLLPAQEVNVVGEWTGRADAPVLIFTAHYDTTTHFGDHFSWGPWGWRLGPAVGAAIALALAGLGLRRLGRELPRGPALALASLTLLPFGAMAWFQALGPLLREPSPGALDNGGSVAALLRLAERLGARSEASATTVRIVFLAAEEERALGSRAYAATLDPERVLAIVNLESVGASETLALIGEDGFALRRFHSPRWLLELVSDSARDAFAAPLAEFPLPEGVLTDGRSFLARGLPAVTLRALVDGGFPRQLHSARDARQRLSPAGIERAVDLLEAILERADRPPRDAAAGTGLTSLPARR